MNLHDLNIYLQQVKNANRPLVLDPRIKLSIPQQEAIEIGGGGGIVEIALADITTLISTSSLSPGTYYVISGVDVGLYGGTTIILQAITASYMAQSGFGQFQNPLYSSYSMWDPGNSYETGMYAIWGGKVWVSSNGETGSSIDRFNLDDNWTVVNDQSFYNTVWDQITYSFQFDFITSRFDVNVNNYVACDYVSNEWFEEGTRSIAVFKWGYYSNFEQVVSDCFIENSYIDCLNVLGSIQNLNMTNYSYVSGLYLDADSIFGVANIENFCYITGITITGSEVYNLHLNNASYMSSVTFANASVLNLDMFNESSISDSTITSGAFEDVLLSNTSIWTNNNLTSSTVNGCVFVNNSYLGSNTLNSSEMNNVNLDGSSIGSLNLTESYINFLYMRDGEFGNFTTTSSTLNNVFIDAFTVYPASVDGIIWGVARFIVNTINYQFGLSFSGDDGAGGIGAITLPYMMVPGGFYIERVIISQQNMAGDPGAVINLGISNGTGTEGINNTTGLKSNLDNKISYFDMSNGLVSGLPSGGMSTIVASVQNDVISEGTWEVEIVLKNINYVSTNE